MLSAMYDSSRSALRKITCPVCGAQSLVSITRGNNVFICPSCSTALVITVDPNLDVRAVIPASKAEDVEAQISGRYEIVNEELIPLALMPYMDDVKALVEGRNVKITRNLAVALRTLKRIGVLREVG